MPAEETLDDDPADGTRGGRVRWLRFMQREAKHSHLTIQETFFSRNAAKSAAHVTMMLNGIHNSVKDRESLLLHVYLDEDSNVLLVNGEWQGNNPLFE